MSRPELPEGRLRQVTVTTAGAVGLLALAGFAASFEKVSRAARPTFGPLAPMVPVAVDLAVLVFAVLGLLLAYVDMPSRWLRIVPWALTGVTVTLNVTGERTVFGVVAHAALPGLWLLAVAVAEHVIRHRLALDTGTRMDAVRVSRWLLAPWSTAGLWRRMVLWEIRSYPAALDRERRRLLAVAWLRDAYGLAWRVRAPRRQRVLHRLGELDPDQKEVEVLPPLSEPERKPRGRRPAKPAGRQRTDAQLRDLVLAEIDAGRLPDKPTADAIRKAVACSPSRARAVRDALRATLPGGGAVGVAR